MTRGTGEVTLGVSLTRRGALAQGLSGSFHDIPAARTHALGALYPAAAQGLPTLTDKGYAGAGIGIQVP